MGPNSSINRRKISVVERNEKEANERTVSARETETTKARKGESKAHRLARVCVCVRLRAAEPTLRER